MGSKQLIVYGTASGAVRRIIVDENDRLDPAVHAGPGESAIVVDKPIDQRADVHFARRAVEAAIGKPSPDLKSAIVDKDGLVIAVVPADPALDDVPGHDLVEAYHAEIAPGDTYHKPSGLFHAKERRYPPGSIVDDVSGEANDVEVVIPSKVLPKPIQGGR